jgi:hypothetical protein|tara:strand:+ start:38 stop:412 length:375 start_codon:yes stop_codon:yes gene_type:complete
MKMTDVVAEGTLDDLGLKGHGRELDKDIDPMKKRYDQDLITVQAGKLSDYQDGGEIVTDGGAKHRISNQEAKLIRNLDMKKLAPLFGVEYAMARDPEADDKIQTALQSEEGFTKLLDLMRKSNK